MLGDFHIQKFSTIFCHPKYSFLTLGTHILLFILSFKLPLVVIFFSLWWYRFLNFLRKSAIIYSLNMFIPSVFSYQWFLHCSPYSVFPYSFFIAFAYPSTSSLFRFSFCNLAHSLFEYLLTFADCIADVLYWQVSRWC